MNVLMISLDKTLLGTDYSGDALERHKEYAATAGFLKVIVFSKGQKEKRKINDRLTVFSTGSKSKLSYIKDAFKIAREINQSSKIDLIVVQDPFLTAWAGWKIKKNLKVPLLIHFHGDFWGNSYWLRESFFNIFFLLLSKQMVKKADGIRVVSSGIKDKLMDGEVPEYKIRVIPTPVDVESFTHPDWQKVKANQEKNKGLPTILQVSRDDKSKDFDTLMKAFDLVFQKRKSVFFWQIGAGQNKLVEKYPKSFLIQEGRDFLRSDAKLQKEDLINTYYAADMLVSSSAHESFGKVLIEAMACGIPVVATATTGSKSIITDGVNGYLVPVGDYLALSERILFLLGNPEKAVEIGRKGQQLVKDKFDHRESIKKIIDFWQDLNK